MIGIGTESVSFGD